MNQSLISFTIGTFSIPFTLCTLMYMNYNEFEKRDVLKVERLNSSRSHYFVKARFNCLPTDNFLAEVVPWGSLAWAMICSQRVLAFFFDLAHISSTQC